LFIPKFTQIGNFGMKMRHLATLENIPTGNPDLMTFVATKYTADSSQDPQKLIPFFSGIQKRSDVK
jgi:hypothetical protein